MDFGVLGQIEARRDGDVVSLGSFKQRSLLALLLIHPNQVVSTDRIIDDLWGDGPASDRHNALWVNVSNLRSALEPGRGKRSEGTLLLTRGSGYLLQIDPEGVDAWRFEQLVREARGLLDPDPAAASMVAAEALALWRGRPYADVMYEPFAQPEIGRLDELRLEAVELRIDADLRRGLAAELIGELEGLAREHPMRERFTAQLMAALYRSGRQAEALRAFSRLRSRLGEELGIEPSAELRALEERIVVGDRSLDSPGASFGPHSRLAVRGYEIREPLGEGGFAYRAYQPAIGREVAIKIIRPESANDPAFIRRFEAEAEVIARLEHPQIVPLYDYWREPDAAYLVMRILRGGNLADAVRRRPLDAAEAAQMVHDVGSALALAHRHGVVHRDIKPANILLDDDGRAYLSDFGIAVEHGTVTDPHSPSLGTTFDSPYSPPEHVAGRTVTASSDIFSLASVLAYALTGRAPDNADGPMTDIPAPLAQVIEQATAFDPGVRYADAASFVQAVQAAVGAGAAEAAPAAANPYKGLRAFDESDATDFFGRERLVERLLARLGDTGTRGRFVALIGPSGSGKSSVVKAGLLPALRGNALPGSADWFVADMSPGRHPYEELEAALLRVAVDPPPGLLEQLTDGETGIRRAVRHLLGDPRAQLVLVVDQFEELFTQAPAPTAHAFLDALAAAVDDARCPLRVVATLRADFYDRPLRHRGIGELLRRGTEVVTPMSPDEVERAITGPAEQAGVQFEAGLVSQIVADVAEHPGALPLLQYALTELFDRRRGEVIQLSAYRDLGGLAAAVAHRAEILYGELEPSAQEAARQALLRMVVLGEGTEDVRRRVPRQELTELGDPAVDEVLTSFGDHRLLSFDRDPVTRGPTVEIAHEALLTEWSRLRAWIDDSRADLRQQRQVAAGAAEWQGSGRDSDYLLRGSRLDQLADWAAASTIALDPGERAFLDASVDRRDEERAADETRRREEERLRLRTRSRSRLLVASGVAMAVIVALATVAYGQRNEANRLARELSDTAEARRLASASTLMADDDPELAMLLALQSLDASARAGLPALVESEEALHWALQGRVPYGHPDAPVEVRVGPNGPTGVFRLPLEELTALATAHLGERGLTGDECSRYAVDPCPSGAADSAWPSVPREPARPPLPAQDAKPLAGTRISIVGNPGAGLAQVELDAFQDRTGIEVRHLSDDELAEFDTATNRVPDDVAVYAADFQARESGQDGRVIDLSTFLDLEEARAQFGDWAVASGGVDGAYYGVPVQSVLKGIVWYPLQAFTDAGYAIPDTWDGLMALSRQMVADGRTPWCLGFESDAFSGWPGTDWIEALVLRLGGVDLYDRWTAGEVGFDDPVVREAFTRFGQVAFGEGFVRYGTEAISRTSHFDAMNHLTSDPPGCWMNLTGSWMPTNVLQQTGGVVGGFVLPPVEPGGDAPVIGESPMLGAIRDRPEIREFVRWLLDPEWGVARAADPEDWFLSPNVEFDASNCRSPELPDDVNAVHLWLCQTQRDTLAAGLQRGDASDRMPPNIGGPDESDTPGAFLQGMLDYVDQGPDSLDEVLADIEAAWP